MTDNVITLTESDLQERIANSIKAYLGRPNECYNVDSYNMRFLAAGVSSSIYAQKHMRQAKRQLGWDGMFVDLIALIPPALAESGLFMEFGVYNGQSINKSAHYAPTRTFYGFDSFEGLPDAWMGGVGVGLFKTAIPKVKDNVKLIVGYFDHSLPAFLDEHTGPAAYIHIDCDIYSSTVTVLNALRKRIVANTVILFDEYFNYPEWEHHEHKAWMEFCESWGIKFKYVSLLPAHMKVGVQVMSVG
jgi:hypothetical protein